MGDVAPMCLEFEPDTAASQAPVSRCKRPPAVCTQETDTAVMSDSGDESVTSSCGSSASLRSPSRSFSFSAPTISPSSDEGTSKQASASSLVSPNLLQNQGFQEGWLRELEAMGVPTTDSLDEALQSEGRLAYMPPRKKRPSSSASSVAFPSSPLAEASLQVRRFLSELNCFCLQRQPDTPASCLLMSCHAGLLCLAHWWRTLCTCSDMLGRMTQVSTPDSLCIECQGLRDAMYVWTCNQGLRAAACIAGRLQPCHRVHQHAAGSWYEAASARLLADAAGADQVPSLRLRLPHLHRHRHGLSFPQGPCTRRRQGAMGVALRSRLE